MLSLQKLLHAETAEAAHCAANFATAHMHLLCVHPALAIGQSYVGLHATRELTIRWHEPVSCPHCQHSDNHPQPSQNTWHVQLVEALPKALQLVSNSRRQQKGRSPLNGSQVCLFTSKCATTSAGLVRAQEVHTVHSKAASRLEHLQQERTWNVIKLEHREAAQQAAHSHEGAPTDTTTAITTAGVSVTAAASSSSALDSNLNNHQEQQQQDAPFQQDVTPAADLGGRSSAFSMQAGALGQQSPAVVHDHHYPVRQASVRPQLAPAGTPHSMSAAVEGQPPVAVSAPAGSSGHSGVERQSSLHEDFQHIRALRHRGSHY